MTVYISGPISGTSDYVERFKAAEEELISADAETHVINPVEIAGIMPAETPWGRYLQIELHLLNECDAIYMLRGWEKSRGAQIEKLYAEGCGKSVLFQHN